MPAYHNSFDDEEIADAARYVRTHLASDQPARTNLEQHAAPCATAANIDKKRVAAHMCAALACLARKMRCGPRQFSGVMPDQTISSSTAIDRASPSSPGNSDAFVMFIRYSHFIASTRTLAGKITLCSNSSLLS